MRPLIRAFRAVVSLWRHTAAVHLATAGFLGGIFWWLTYLPNGVSPEAESEAVAADRRAVQNKARKRSYPARVADQLAIDSPPLSAREQQRLFHLPDGFEIELVLSEGPGVGKFVTVAFDPAGRLWTMTALEYPVDANDDPEASRQLFERGGRDKVLVLDDPYGPQPAEPRVFADGLAIPLGILPYRDGVFVQYGEEIRFYEDRNGDGRADGYRVVLTGFGTQDSHLFPHQFTRVPGGWVLMAQGLFNVSVVRRPDGRPFAGGQQQVVFRHCKLARFRLDGSDFELLTAGPNNIWGLTISHEGEIWIQEANDLGYPIIPFMPGGRYATPSPDRLKPYQPLMPPPLSPPQMGGTGLSGLALADDRDGWPVPWGARGRRPGGPRRFYVANPVIGRIQVIEAVPLGGGRYRYRKLDDFLRCDDPRFRPVALQFGPDGCLYVVDWYNKIISHNEVPRNHPERDRTRGRIWRIRHRSQPRRRPPDLTRLSPRELLAYLGADNTLLAQLAWQQIVDRREVTLVPDLRRIVADQSQPDSRRLGALWALEGLVTVSGELLVQLARDPSPHLRREAVRIAGAQRRPEHEFVTVAELLLDDPDWRVRAALGDSLRRVELSSEKGMALLLRYAKPPLDGGDPWCRYERALERFLVRWAMERHARRLAQFLQSPAAERFPLESRLLATLALPGPVGAVALVRMIPRLQRPLDVEEIRLLAQYMHEPAVAEALRQALGEVGRTARTLQVLLELRNELDLTALQPEIASAVVRLWHEAPVEEATRLLLVDAAGAFRVSEMEQALLQLAGDEQASERLRRAALRALRGIGVRRPQPLLALIEQEPPGSRLRELALTALAESSEPSAQRAVAKRLSELTAAEKRLVLGRLASSRPGARAILAAIERGDLESEELPIRVLEQLRVLLPESETVRELWAEVADRVQYVLRLNGGPNDYVADPITLKGPFTVEAWVRLDPDISNADGILAAPGQLDMNFYQARFRVWVQGHHDIVIARREVKPGSWTHVAVTRDGQGRFRIYINGELDAVSKEKETRSFVGLQIGRTIPSRTGTRGEIAEFRVWNRALSDAEIRDRFDWTYRGSQRPAGLVLYRAGRDWGRLSGSAAVVPVMDGPVLQTPAEARARAALFERYRRLASQPGDLKRGRALFERHCLVCHTVGGKGGQIGPPLDGVGLKGLESLLRNVLTPSAAVEAGYRNYRVLTEDGRLIEGLLVAETEDAVVIRQPDRPDQRIAKRAIARAGYTRTSVMPEGLLQGLRDEQARDLLRYVLSLK